MSRNLVQLVRRHHAMGAPRALDVLKQAVEDHGEITDEDRRRAAAASGLPEAAVYGVSSFYDDLLVARGARHVRVCTGTACFAATGGAHVDAICDGLALRLGERCADRSLSLAETVCLGFCHSSPAIRDGDLIDAGAGAVQRAIAGSPRPAAEPDWESLLPEPVLTRAGDWSGLRRALTELGPDALLEAVEAAVVRGRGGAGFPAGAKWRFARAAQGTEKFIVANGDEGDPGSYIDKYLMERNPDLLLEGIALAGFAVGAGHGFVLTRSEYPAAKPALDAAIERAREAGWLGENILGSGFDFDITVLEGAGSYVVGEETALLSCLQGLRGTVSARPPFPAERGLFGRPTVVNNTETLANIPFIAAAGAQAYAALSPCSPTGGSKLVCFNERFVRPTVVEVPFGMTVRELCEDVAGGLRDGHAIKAVQIGGPLGGILPASRLDTAFDFDPLAAEGCMVGHGSIVAFDERTDMRALAVHLLRFGAHESCGKCFPCRIGLRRAHDMLASGEPVDRAALEQLLEALELASLCAHGGGMPAPIRSLLAHFPQELGLG
ncbi:MAG TPA: NADH-ubiquinone oxidoreductase-F iron-sulfur binding region domain-containing protein [Solirubrobacteraceae bacterium]|nr:NADH-ubiquinone oxidoreductase-F iron-sulfur binding region domain-containing protein [Solirubrobacteraceae bacterium]